MKEGAPKTREVLLQEKVEAVRGRKDRIGGEMDEQIVEAVALVNLLGLPTHGSCGGHPDHGLANPWVAVTALDEPDFAHVGERETKAAIALTYGLQTDDIERGRSDEADEEYYAWLRGDDSPLTPEYETWRGKRDEVVRRADELVRQFNADRNDTETVHVTHGRISVGNDEKAPAETDPEGLAARLKERQAVMSAFTDFLRSLYLSHS